MPGDTCATCRLDRQAEEVLQAEQEQILFGAVDNSRLDNAERDHQPWVKEHYLGNWPGKQGQEQGR